MNGSMRDAPPATMYTSAGGALAGDGWEREWGALTAYVTELTAALEALRVERDQVLAERDQACAERDRALAQRDAIQVLAEDCTKDLGHAMADMLDLRDRHEALAAERDRLGAELAVRVTDADRMRGQLAEEMQAGEELATRLGAAQAELDELRLLLQASGTTRRGLFGRGGTPAGGRRAAPARVPGKPSAPPRAQELPAPEAVEDALARRLRGED